MSEEFERAISDLLIASKDTDVAVKKVIRSLKDRMLSRHETENYLNFLLNAGRSKECLEIYIELFKTKYQVPLYSFCHLLHRSGFRPNKIFFDSLFEANEKVTKEDRFNHLDFWKNLDPRIPPLQQRIQQQLIDQAEERKQKLLGKLEYLSSQRILQEEEKLLKNLIDLFPQDNEIKSLWRQFQDRWAEEIISKPKHKSEKNFIDEDPPQYSDSEWAILDAIVSGFKSEAKKNKRLRYDLAIGLYFMELYDHAREIIEKSTSTLALDWFYIQSLVKARRFAESLDAIYHIEKRYANDPETAFGATYYRALALFGLGQSGPAIELLRSIVAIRPSYRSAHSLLLKWGGTT